MLEKVLIHELQHFNILLEEFTKTEGFIFLAFAYCFSQNLGAPGEHLAIQLFWATAY